VGELAPLGTRANRVLRLRWGVRHWKMLFPENANVMLPARKKVLLLRPHKEIISANACQSVPIGAKKKCANRCQKRVPPIDCMGPKRAIFQKERLARILPK